MSRNPITLEIYRALPERRQHNDGVVTERMPEGPKSTRLVVRDRAAAECWLDRYQRRGYIDDAERAAGLMFRDAWLHGVRGIKTHDPMLPKYATGDAHAAMDLLVGSERVRRICLKKLTPTQRIAVVKVCGEDQALGTTAAIRTLRRALDAIGRTSRLVSEADNKYLARRLETFL